MGVKWCIICSSDYEDKEITPLEGAYNSVKELYSVVSSQLGVPESDIIVFYNKDQTEISNKISDFQSELSASDTVIFYYCGHGIKSGGQLWLYVKNTRLQNVEISALNYQSIIQCFKRSKVKRIIAILDCCNSGAAVNMGLEQNDIVNNEVICEGEVTLCSCAEIEASIQKEINHKKYCVFTYIFSCVLSQGSNNNSKEYLSIGDLVSILKERYESESGKTLTIGTKQELDKAGLIKNMSYVRKISHEKSEELEQIREKIKKRKTWKVLLVKCAIKYPTRGGDFGIPMGLWVLKNYISLARPNVQVDIYDERLLDVGGKEKDYENLIDKYDIIGISMCTCEVPCAIEKFKIAHNNGKITVAGGIFTYSNEKYLLSTGVIDYVIPGVGTVPWVRLLDALMANGSEKKQIVNVNNVFSKNNMGTVVWLTDIMPRLELNEWDEVLEQYGLYINREVTMNSQKYKVPKIDIVTSRGCNKNCNFCSVRFETGSAVIKRQATAIEEEIDYLYSKGVRYFSIKDEDFFIHGINRVKEIMHHCKTYKDIRFKVRMRLDAWEKFSSQFDIETFREWGIDEIQYGVESPQSDILRMLQKGMSIEKNNVSSLFQEHYKNEIKVNASFILGCAELEDTDYYDNLERFLEEIYDDNFLIPYLNFYTPHPTHSTILNDKYMVTTDDYNYYTHKVPVAYPKNMHQPEREKMIDTYENIVNNTKSRKFNPPIPKQAKEQFIKGKMFNKYKN